MHVEFGFIFWKSGREWKYPIFFGLKYVRNFDIIDIVVVNVSSTRPIFDATIR